MAISSSDYAQNRTFAKLRLGILWKEKIDFMIFSFQTLSHCLSGGYRIIYMPNLNFAKL